jgi:hypothetical protein
VLGIQPGEHGRGRQPRPGCDAETNLTATVSDARYGVMPPPSGPAPGACFPDRIRLTGTSHHLLMFGEVTALDRFRGRWNGLVSVEDGVGAGVAVQLPPGR